MIRCYQCRSVNERKSIKRNRINGVVRCLCASCAKKHVAKVINTQGKARRPPKNDNFTHSRTEPIQVDGYPGHDVRYYVDPSFKGAFSILGPGRYL